MNYKAYRLYFPVGIHIGRGTLEESGFSFGADTLFSALCIEARRRNKDDLEKLVSFVRDGQLLLSDALPYIGEHYYVPKPMLHIPSERDGISTEKKAFKKLDYIPADKLERFLSGQLDAGRELNYFRNLGKEVSKTGASVRGEEQTVPYRVGMFQFSDHAGLYVIVGYEGEQILNFLEELLTALSYSGIGGKRSSGMGRFELFPCRLHEKLERRLTADGNRYMTLSVSLPADGELEAAVCGATYLLVKRSGFVASEEYADSLLRKRDLYVFRAGSCFAHTFQGDIFDVSSQGLHPVYRYAKPMFMEVDV
ncbi:MAG: type III-A CRISPR-associated RAMP protein Csm4 [Lachnospiraceae bacterium]|nr:type III-A CRISPR-associated RAMP protein Csm4 [Lachnospiraceae bacterium]